MTIRCRSKFSALLFSLPLGLCFASTSLAASDDDDEEWRDTKGPRSERARSDERDLRGTDGHSEQKTNKDEPSDTEKSDDEDSSQSKRSKKEFNSSTDAFASDSAVSAALLGSYGLPDPQGPGIGVRGGLNVRGAIPLYFGGVIEHFFGMTVEAKNFDVVSSRNRRFTYFGGEAGVNVAATEDLTIRPYFGLGIGIVKDKVCSGDNECVGGSKVRLVLDPGIVGLYRIGSFFVGPDIRYLIVPGGGTASGVTFSATVGMHF
jgi:hypothetical protein